MDLNIHIFTQLLKKIEQFIEFTYNKKGYRTFFFKYPLVMKINEKNPNLPSII